LYNPQKGYFQFASTGQRLQLLANEIDAQEGREQDDGGESEETKQGSANMEEGGASAVGGGFGP